MGKKGTLYLCPTPIGNLEDITLRALRILKEVDLIAAEDTRVTIKLLNHFEIKTPLISYHEHNKKTQGAKLISLLKEGKNIALVSDAGTPGISDPGEDLVRQAIEEGINVVPLPGAAAAICALVASGLSTQRFVFEGFLPQKAKERAKRLAELVSEQRTLVFYEAPHRIVKTLKAIKDALGNRRVTVAREMTKLHEEFIRGSLEEIIQLLEKEPHKGEMVIVLEGANPDLNSKKWQLSQKREPQPSIQELRLQLESMVKDSMAQGYAKNHALKKAAAEMGISRNEAYELLLNKK